MSLSPFCRKLNLARLLYRPLSKVSTQPIRVVLQPLRRADRIARVVAHYRPGAYFGLIQRRGSVIWFAVWKLRPTPIPTDFRGANKLMSQRSGNAPGSTCEIPAWAVSISRLVVRVGGESLAGTRQYR